MTDTVEKKCAVRSVLSVVTETAACGARPQQCSVCLANKRCVDPSDLSFRRKDISEYIVQHLGLAIDLIAVCQHCWEMLEGFHGFFEMVNMQHQIQQFQESNVKMDSNLLNDEAELLLSVEFVEIKDEPLEVSVKDAPEPLEEKYFADEISTTAEEDCKRSEDGDTDSAFSKKGYETRLISTIQPKRENARTNTYNGKTKRNPALDDDILEFYKRLVCEICDPETMITGEPSIEYSNLKDLNRHMRKLHGQEMGSVKCPMCDKRFRSRVKLLEHRDMHLNPDQFRCEVCKEVHQNVEEHMKNKHQEWRYCCEECGKRFPFKARLTAHIRKIHTAKDAICDQCQKPFSKYTIEDHKRSVHGASFMCAHCPRTFKSRFPLEQHMEEHIEGLRRAAAVSCNICGIVVRNKYSLSTHIKRMHTEHPPVSCGSCGKVFKSKHNLDAHLAHVCTDRSFPCSICGKQFKKKIKLKEHMTTHTKSALYQCQYCPKTFSFETQLYTHRKQAHYEQWLELQQKRKEGERFKVKRIVD